MSEALETTLRLLAETENEAAVRVLIPGLDSRYLEIREGVLRAILSRRSPACHREVLRRLHLFDQRWTEIVREYRGRMTQALRDAVLATDRLMCTNGCRAVIWFREYDLVPALLNALADQANPNVEVVGRTLIELVETLYTQLAAPRDYADWRDPQLVRRHVVGALELSVKRFAVHRRREVIEAFLLLAGRDNAALKQILHDPHHAAFVVLVDVLSKSTREGVIRLLLGFLDDPHAPSAALSVLSNRDDPRFVRYLLRKIGREPSSSAARNLKRIESIRWLRNPGVILDQLDDLCQHAAVKMTMGSGVPRSQAYGVIKYLLNRGKPGGRRAAAEAIAQFMGADANALAIKSLGDPDPQVQANIVLHLRSRGIPGTLSRLVEMIDSPHGVVRRAIQESLAEFAFRRFLGAFDMLDDEVRHGTGMLVKKIDPQTIPLLGAELKSPLRTRRVRGLAIVQEMDAVDQLESQVVALLDDEDHLVRAEAAVTLGQSNSPAAREALRKTLHDSSLTVQEAARKSLHGQTQFNEWRETLFDPRD